MLTVPEFERGLGQLEAYLGVDEGVSFQMDNNLYWDSLSTGSRWAIQGRKDKKLSSIFSVTQLPSGKVMLKDWTDMYLAIVERRTDPRTFPVQLLPYSEGPNLQFEVFYKDNKVAFQSYNGLFLGRVCRASDTLEATMFFPDESCFFLPLIGALHPPAFSIVNVIPVPFIDGSPVSHLVGWQTYVNSTEEAKKHTFTMTWETQSTDRTFWTRLWGRGVPSSYRFSFWNAKPIVAYTQDNEHIPCVQRDISETLTKEVEVPSLSKAMALFFVDWHHNAFFLFTAYIEKFKPNGSSEAFTESGGWMGLVYRNLRIEVKYKEL
ncbi:hypothetical protein JD844_010557 [Phrynosoma platyrhinos]|uniref:Uncharacterized protein n=1 Tax=Phrynosoma platyrhinos TaxID=52577 RepID=A0ABQ7TGQ2_PHRPL|nr:hypothetical protein JD844_010557 [Phrynosoma platyrhinos]